MRLEILGDERRRRCGDERKLEIVLSVGGADADLPEELFQKQARRRQSDRGRWPGQQQTFSDVSI